MRKRTDEELQQLTLKRRREMAENISTIHKILSGRYKPEDGEKNPNLKIKDILHGKFFTVPTPGIGPQLETPALYEKQEDLVPTEDWRNLFDPDIDPRAP